MSLIIGFLIGFAAGFMSGMFGIGGGSIRTPLLYVAGLPLLSAFGINLLVIPFSSLTGAISHRKNINWKLAPYVIMGGASGSVIGAYLAGLIPTLVLAVIFVVISLLTVSGIYLDRIAPRLAQKINPNPKNMVGGTFFLNLLTGMRRQRWLAVPSFSEGHEAQYARSHSHLLIGHYFHSHSRCDYLLVPGRYSMAARPGCDYWFRSGDKNREPRFSQNKACLVRDRPFRIGCDACAGCAAESSTPDLLISEISSPVGDPVVPVLDFNLDLPKFAVRFVVHG